MSDIKAKKNCINCDSAGTPCYKSPCSECRDKNKWEEKQQREQGCEYCSEVKPKDIQNLYKESISYARENNVNQKISIKENKLSMFTRIDKNKLISEKKINYCPMCGRRLSRE